MEPRLSLRRGCREVMPGLWSLGHSPPRGDLFDDAPAGGSVEGAAVAHLVNCELRTGLEAAAREMLA